MRDFLTGLAIILIVVLTTVLVAPYFVDWNGQRGFLEARLTTALGQKVTIGGNIDLRLLPTPYLVLDQVVVGGDDGPMRIGVHRLNLELSVAPLIHGEFDIVEARLLDPTIRLSLEQDRSFPALPAAPAFTADVRFDRIKIVNGTLALADPESGRTFVYDHLDIDADAGSFAGPFKVFGAEGTKAHRTKFRLSTTAVANGQAHAKFVIDETKEHAGLDLDGTVDLRAASGGRVRQNFDGSLVLSGHLVQPEREPVGWRLSGPFKLDPSRGVLEAGDLRLGSEEAGLTLQADARADLGDTPKLAIDLKAKQLDIDRLAGAPLEADKPPPPPQLPDLATLRQMLAAVAPPIQTSVDLAVETATYGGDTLSGIEAHLALGDAARQPLKLAIDGPGGAHVVADGTFDGARGVFEGTVDAEADNLRRTVDWLDRVAPSFTWKATDVAFKTVKLAGKVTTARDGIDGTGLSIRLDRSRLAGTAHLAMAEAARPAKLTADLKAEALDLDGLPSLQSLRSGASALDLDLRLDANTAKVSRFGDGALGTGRIKLAVTKAGRQFEMNTLRIEDLGGATLQADGRLDPQGGRFGVTLDATRLDAAAGLVRQLLPGAGADALVARASALAPAKLKFDLVLASDAAGALAPKALSMTGTAAKTKVSAEVKPQDGATAVSAALEAPEGSVLLRQLGFGTVSIETVGPGRVTFSARGHANEPYDTKLSAMFGTTSLDVSGRFGLPPSTLAGSGTFALRSADLSPLVQAMAIAFPDLTGRLPADAAGTIKVGDDAVELDPLKGQLAGVGVRGALRWARRLGDGPSLTGTLDLDHLVLSSLLGLALGHEQPAEGDAAWSRQPLATGLIDPPRVALRLGARSLGVLPGLEARKAILDLSIGPGVVTLDKFSAEILDGRTEGNVVLRRDGRQATLEGRLGLHDVAVHLPGVLDTRMDGHLDLAGSGTSASGLVASLAGTGEATATGIRVPDADPAAVRKVFEDVETDALAADPDATARAYAETAKTPLATEPRTFGLRLAAGDIHLVPKDRPTDRGQGVASKIAGSFDLGRFRVEERVEETLETLPKNWSGPPPTVVIALEGPIGKPARTIDMSGFSNALTARAVAREGARIEAGALDIRERGLFSTRLKFEERREAERQKAEDDARKAEAERKARVEAQRKERQRREKEKAEREEAEKAAREHPGEAPGQSPEAPQRSSPDAPQPPPPAAGKDPSSLGRY